MATERTIVRVVEMAMDSMGRPAGCCRIGGGVFTSAAFEAMCAARAVKHQLIRPAHPWTNGRIERVFRTFKEEVLRRYVWIREGRAD